MAPQPNKLVVIGGVAAGTSAAGRAKRTDPSMEVVIFEKDYFVSYGACDEPYYIKGEIESWENLLVRAPEEFEKRQNIKIRLRHEVTAIDVPKKTVTVKNLETGEIFDESWDRLILATGARPRPLELPGNDLVGVFQLKFLNQARQIKEFIDRENPETAVILGAGFIALEMAEALSHNGIAVTICHRSNKPGGRTEEEIADKIRETLAENGVRYIPDCAVQKLLSAKSGKVGQVLTDKGTLLADMVLVATGVVPSVELARQAKINIGPTGAIETDEKMATSIKNIWAAGDCCQTIQRITGRPMFTPLGDIANKQGWTAGENSAGGDALFRGGLGSVHFRCFDLEVGMTGLNEREAKEDFQVVSRTIQHRSRAHAQPKGVKITVKLIVDKKTHRIIGAQTAGKEGAAHRINTLAVAVHNGMTIEEMNELDFAYAPPFSAVIDPILMAARVILKDLRK